MCRHVLQPANNNTRCVRGPTKDCFHDGRVTGDGGPSLLLATQLTQHTRRFSVAVSAAVRLGSEPWFQREGCNGHLTLLRLHASSCGRSGFGWLSSPSQLAVDGSGNATPVHDKSHFTQASRGRLSLPPKNESLAERLNSSKESQEDEQDDAGALHARIQAGVEELICLPAKQPYNFHVLSKTKGRNRYHKRLHTP